MYFLSLPGTSLEARAWKDQSRCSFGNVGQRNCPSMPSLILRCRHRAHQRQKKGLLVSASYRESLGRAVQCLLRSEPADVCDFDSKSPADIGLPPFANIRIRILLNCLLSSGGSPKEGHGKTSRVHDLQQPKQPRSALS
jgi:hypothetical protein